MQIPPATPGIKLYVGFLLLKLAIAADGSIHNEPAIILAHIERQKNLEAQGIQFIRFTKEEIIPRLEMVIEKINLAIDKFSKNKEV